MPTILSRFDMIFIVKDEHNEERDMVCGAAGAAGTQGAPSFGRRRRQGPSCSLTAFCFPDAGQARDGLTRECLDADPGRGGRDRAEQAEEAHLLLSDVSAGCVFGTPGLRSGRQW